MKFLRVANNGQTIPCVMGSDNVARNVSSLINDFTPQTISTMLSLEQAKLSTLPAVDITDAPLTTPITQPPNIYCIGLNYSDHAKEAGMAIPDEPILFNKSSGTYCAPNDPILYSPKMSKLDWEVELGVVISKPAFNVSKEAALDYVLGYTVVNDVSERNWQLEHGGQWAKGKSFPNFCPTGPWLVTGDEVDHGKALDMWLEVNGQRMQDGNTRTMIFDVATIISYLSQFLRLEAGDLICTGTPPGVGAGMKPPVWLKVGDQVTLGIQGLGEQQQTVTHI